MVYMQDFSLWKKIWSLACDIECLFQDDAKLTLSQIKKKLDIKQIDYNDSEFMLAIKELFIKRGNIIKDDFWSKEAEYFKLDKHFESSSYSKHYYSFEVDDYNSKSFLLISDTHIGDENLEDFLLLDRVYDYAIKRGVTKCFHLGDLFAGKIDSGDFNLQKKMIQIKRFAGNYPKPLPNEMMTYAVQGNHDEQIDDILWHTGYSDYDYDLRELSFLNPSFYMFSRNFVRVDFSNLIWCFSHRFHHSTLIPNLKVTCSDDLINSKRWLDEKYDVHISGHLHKGLIYGAGPSQFSDKDQIFLGVPSTSKLNINGVVAYVVNLNYNNKLEITNMDVSVLNCDNNYKINEYELFNWNFNNNNDIHKKVRIYR